MEGRRRAAAEVAAKLPRLKGIGSTTDFSCSIRPDWARVRFRVRVRVRVRVRISNAREGSHHQG